MVLIKSQKELDTFNRAFDLVITTDKFPIFIADGWDVLTQEDVEGLVEKLKQAKFEMEML